MYLKTVYKNDNNLNNYLVSNFFLRHKEGSYIKCKNSICKICKFSITDRVLYNFKGLPLSIPINSSCNSTNIIYFIHCKKCNTSYIGESGRTALKRISEHLYKIKKLKKIKNSLDLSNELNKCGDSAFLYRHFINTEHNLIDHFRFQIYIKDIVNYRLRLESDLIHIFNTLNPNGLNTKISNFCYYFESYKNPSLI